MDNYPDVPQHGSSGAKIITFEQYAIKYQLESPRIAAQALWLMKYQSPAVPLIFANDTSFYVMERLTQINPLVLDHSLVLHDMVDLLIDYVWSRPANVEFDRDAFALKIVELTNRVDKSGWRSLIFNLMNKIDWNNLPRTLTHGDPTFENVMIRASRSQLVFIDPIPATPAVPDIRAVDFGKILQSILGWEAVRYGADTYRFKPSINLRQFVKDDNEWQATVFWCTVHILRAMPYVHKDLHDDLGKMISNALSLL